MPLVNHRDAVKNRLSPMVHVLHVVPAADLGSYPAGGELDDDDAEIDKLRTEVNSLKRRLAKHGR